MNTLIPALAALLLTASSTLHAAPPPVTAPRSGQAPVIDGNLVDLIWRSAPWQKGFTELGTGKPSERDTRFAVAYDDRFLYVAIRCTEPNPEQIKAEVTQRDDTRLYNDDVVELFVAPGPQRTDYYQFELNSKGVLADAACHQSGTVREATWNSAVQVATSRANGEWIVEMAIPLADMELGKPAPGDWGINVARVRRAGGEEELSTFVPMTGSFHQPALFAGLSLPGANFDALRWEISPPVGLTVTRENETNGVSAKLSMKNLTGKPRPVAVTTRLRLGDKMTEGKPISDILDAGQSKTYEVALPLPGDGPQTFEVEVADRRDPKVLFARRSFAVNLTFTPLALTLLEPAYQDAIYASQKLTQLSGSLAIALSNRELEGASASISLSPEDATAKPLATIQMQKLSATMDFALPIPELAEGRYRLRVALLDANGRETRSLERLIRKLPPAPSGVEWRINQSGILLRNEEPFLAVGWYSLATAAMKEASSNVTWLYMGPWQSVEELRKTLDEIGAVGGYAVIYPTVNDRRPEELTIATLSEKDTGMIRQRVRALKDHPALLGWYLADEPEYHLVLPESVQQLRSVISEEDPWHPTIVVNNAFGAIRRFAQGGDIIAPDTYPFFKQGGVSPSIGKVGAFVAEAAAAAQPGQTVWIVPQAHDTRDFGGKGERAPTFLESRNMVWQAVSAGARGVVWWDWGWVFPNTIDSVHGNAYLARELSALKAYVLAPVEGGVETASPQKAMLRSALRSADGQHALFAASAATAPQDVLFKAPSLAGRELVVLGEGRTVKVGDDGTLADRFEPFATHLYLTDPAFAEAERLTAVQEKIDAANVARKQPGNLAFEESGVTLRISSQGDFQPTPVWMVDGVRGGRSWAAKPFAGSDWIELTWPKPQTLGRIAIWTDAVADCDVQVAKGEGDKTEWLGVASIKEAAGNPIELSFEPVETSRIRIKISRLRPGNSATRIGEIEAFGK